MLEKRLSYLSLLSIESKILKIIVKYVYQIITLYTLNLYISYTSIKLGKN